MFYKHICCILFLVAAVGEAIAQAMPDWTRAGGLPSVAYIDIRFDVSAEGERQPTAFTFEGQTYRLFVRDVGVATSRGPHDRICVEAVSQWGPGPGLILTETSAGPDGRRPVFQDRRAVGTPNGGATMCELLPTAPAYRIWKNTKTRLSAPPAGTDWRMPTVFKDFEPMMDQDDRVAVANNIEKMIKAINFDGVCADIAVVYAPFRDPEGILSPLSWVSQFEGIKHVFRRMSETGITGKTYGQFSGILNPSDFLSLSTLEADDMILPGFPLSYAGIAYPVPIKEFATGGFAQLVGLGFMSKEQLERYQAEFPLARPPIDDYLLVDGSLCRGEPIQYKVRGIDRELPLYAFVRVIAVIPYWLEYETGSEQARQYWRTQFNRVMRHELLHLYDYLDIVNETVFRMKGEVGLMKELIDQRVGPPEARRWGMIIDKSLGYKSYFYDHFDNIRWGGGTAVNFFHRAIYVPDDGDAGGRQLDIDQSTEPPAEFWDVTSRAYRKAYACVAAPVLKVYGIPSDYERMKALCEQG